MLKPIGGPNLNPMKYGQLRYKIFPNHTKRRHLYDLILKSIKIVVNEGWRSFFEKFKNRIQKQYLNKHFSYESWIAKNEPDQAQLKAMQLEAQSWPYRPMISIIMPVYNPNKYDLTESIKSVLNQIYDNWELCIADGGSDRAHVKEVIENFERNDHRVKFVLLSKNHGIAGNTNEALKMAAGEYIGFLDHDDLLAPFALYEVVKLLNKDLAIEFLYSDEDKVVPHGKKRHSPHFKPDWSPDTLLSYNYACHFSVISRKVVERIGGVREGYDGAQDHDLILRVVQKTSNVKRIPKILYHWRAAYTSVASDASAKPYAYLAGKKAITEYLKSQGSDAVVLDGKFMGSYRVQYKIRPLQKVSVIIPTKDKVHLLRRCVSSILSRTAYKSHEILIVDNQSRERETQDFYESIANEEKIKIIHYDKPFNFSAINNFAVRCTDSEYLVFLNNDTEVVSREWLSAMLEFAQRKDVGAVGAKLVYPNNSIQHGGVIIGIGGVAGHSHKYFPRSSHGYMGRLAIIQNLSAVTAACMMVRREVFEEVGGFDERLSHAFNDVDLCLKIREKGYLVIYTPYAELYHHESLSRGYEDTPEQKVRFASEIKFMQDRWKSILEAGDPYYNPNLTLDKEDFSLRL
ncbi:MAG: glycosyltransferase family 2 protein [Nitrospirota bacterium]